MGGGGHAGRLGSVRGARPQRRGGDGRPGQAAIGLLRTARVAGVSDPATIDRRGAQCRPARHRGRQDAGTSGRPTTPMPRRFSVPTPLSQLTPSRSTPISAWEPWAHSWCAPTTRGAVSSSSRDRPTPKGEGSSPRPRVRSQRRGGPPRRDRRAQRPTGARRDRSDRGRGRPDPCATGARSPCRRGTVPGAGCRCTRRHVGRCGAGLRLVLRSGDSQRLEVVARRRPGPEPAPRCGHGAGLGVRRSPSRLITLTSRVSGIPASTAEIFRGAGGSSRQCLGRRRLRRRRPGTDSGVWLRLELVGP